MKLVAWKNVRGQILYRSLVPPIKNGVNANCIMKNTIIFTLVYLLNVLVIQGSRQNQMTTIQTSLVQFLKYTFYEYR